MDFTFDEALQAMRNSKRVDGKNVAVWLDLDPRRGMVAEGTPEKILVFARSGKAETKFTGDEANRLFEAEVDDSQQIEEEG
jgi:hypothetical protein